MSEKLKPNFTPVPNVVIDAMMRGLNDSAFKTLIAICRFTYGWGKKSDRISLKQLSDITGITDRSNVHRAIKRLGNLIVITPGNPSKNLASEYRINVDIADDLLSEKQQHLLSGRQHPVVRPVVSSATIQRKIQRNKNTGAKALVSFPHKKKTLPPAPAQLRAFNSWYSAYPRHVGEKPAREAWLKLDPDPALVAMITTATARYVDFKADVEPRYCLDPARWLNEEHWRDELPGGAGDRQATPEAKDLGDGWVLVSGQKMKRETYERRARDDARA